MRGIKYIVDEKGKKTAVVIDLKKYGELWEEFYDYILCLEREKEPDLTHIRPELLQVEGHQRLVHVARDVGQDHGGHEKLEPVGEQWRFSLGHGLAHSYPCTMVGLPANGPRWCCLTVSRCCCEGTLPPHSHYTEFSSRVHYLGERSPDGGPSAEGGRTCVL